jgi:hypothetical protein
LSGCHCTQVAQICQSNTDCSGGRVCVAGQCGFPGDGGGGGGGGGGDGGGGDGGCVNLQCNQVTCPDGGTTSITGTVYDPSGHVPIYNALVYVPNGPVLPFTPGVTCDRCAAFTSGSPLVVALTGADGQFTLRNVPVMPDGGTLPLVIQVGRWRRQVALPGVAACTSTPITDAGTTRLPQNQSEGDIPQMAIATGNADPFECLLLKMGISASEFTNPDAGGRVHYYVSDRNAGLQKNPPAPFETDLMDNLTTLMNYDVVLLPCEGGEYRRNNGSPEPQNLVQYTAAGGRVFTTHYGYVWLAEPENAPFPSTGVWNWPLPGGCDSYNTPLPVTVDRSFLKGDSFAQWLVNVGSSTDAGTLTLFQSRHDLLYTDGGSQQWLYTNIQGCTPARAVEHMTFNTPLNPPPLPDGGPGNQCGRVVYSDFHVSASAIDPDGGSLFPGACRQGQLSPQEKALLFMLLDVSSCVQSENSTCATLGQSCSPNPCCPGSNLNCLAPSGQACNGSSGCTCQPGLR